MKNSSLTFSRSLSTIYELNMTDAVTSPFTFLLKNEEPRTESIKWTRGNTKYEIYVPVRSQRAHPSRDELLRKGLDHGGQ